MLAIPVDKLRDYFSSLYGKNVEIRYVGGFDKEEKKMKKELKVFGYGVPYLIEFSVNGETKSVVLETMKPEGFGHDHLSDRAQILMWQHSVFNTLPQHVRSVDVGAFTRDGDSKTRAHQTSGGDSLWDKGCGKPSVFRRPKMKKNEKKLVKVEKLTRANNA